eukprot:3077163-Rhodomonas_salina.3
MIVGSSATRAVSCLTSSGSNTRRSDTEKSRSSGTRGSMSSGRRGRATNGCLPGRVWRFGLCRCSSARRGTARVANACP